MHIIGIFSAEINALRSRWRGHSQRQRGHVVISKVSSMSTIAQDFSTASQQYAVVCSCVAHTGKSRARREYAKGMPSGTLFEELDHHPLIMTLLTLTTYKYDRRFWNFNGDYKWWLSLLVDPIGEHTLSVCLLINQVGECKSYNQVDLCSLD